MSATEPDFPQSWLSTTSWSFRAPPCLDRDAFLSALCEYNADDEEWTPRRATRRRVSGAFRVEVLLLEEDEAGETHDAPLVVAFRPEAPISGLEVLFGLHVALAGLMEDQDSHYFEGLVLESVSSEGVATYRLRLGS